MAMLSVSSNTHDRITLLTRAWAVSEDEAIARLLDAFQDGAQPGRTASNEEGQIRVHALYDGVRAEGVYHQRTGKLDIVAGPAAGQSFKRPSGAAIAVVQAVNPRVNPNRNGWSFWIVDDDGKTLQSRRSR
jgi:hypothetical protein